MRDLYDTLFAPDRFGRADKWDIEPDYDEMTYEFDNELDELDDNKFDEDDLSLDEWLETH